MKHAGCRYDNISSSLVGCLLRINPRMQPRQEDVIIELKEAQTRLETKAATRIIPHMDNVVDG